MARGELPRDIAESIRRQEQRLLVEGRRFQRFDKIRQREFWSRYLFAPGIGGVIPSNDYNVFQSVEGDTGQGYAAPLTLRETNWPARGRIADNFNLVLSSFHVSICRAPQDPQVYASGTTFGVTAGDIDLNIPPHPADVEAIAKGFCLGVKYLTNTIPIGYLADFPSAGGAYGWVEAARQAPVAGSPGLSETLNGVDNRAHLPLTRNATAAALERRQQIGTLLQHGETFSLVLICPENITLLGANAAAAQRPERNDVTGALEIRVGFWATESFVERS